MNINQQPQEDILTPQDTLEPAGTVMTSTDSVSAVADAPLVDASGVASEPHQSVTAAPADNASNGYDVEVAPPSYSSFKDKSFRKILMIAGGLAAVFMLLAGGTLFVQRSHHSSKANTQTDLNQQTIKLQGGVSAISGIASPIRSGVPTLQVNGDIAAQGSLRLGKNGGFAQISSSGLTSNQTYSLPNSSGTICVSSGNCSGTPGTTTTINTTNNTVIQGSTTINNITNISGGGANGVQSVNGNTGDVIVQSQDNSVIVTNGLNNISLVLPQSIDPSSTPGFQSINLQGIGTQNGFQICDSSDNCGYANGTFSINQGGNDFGSGVPISVGSTQPNEDLQLITNNTVHLSINDQGVINLGGSNFDRLNFNAQIANSSLVFQGQSNSFNTTTLLVANQTQPNQIIIPNESGTICLNNGNCAGAAGVGNVMNTGNYSNKNILLGPNDDFGVSLITHGNARLTVDNVGNTSLLGNVTTASNLTIGTNNTSRLAINSQILGNNFVFQGSTDDANATIFQITEPSHGAGQTIIFPDLGGTVCLNTGNCTGSGLVGGGDINNGGNNIGNITIGTTGVNSLALETNNVPRLTITSTGAATFTGNLAVSGDTTLGATSANRLTVTSQILGQNALVFQGATDNGFATTLKVTDPSQNNIITLPDASGTVCLVGAGCGGPAGGGGDIYNNGNAGTNIAVGTVDSHSLSLITGGVGRLNIAANGAAIFTSDLTVSGNATIGASSGNSVVIQATNLFIPNNLNIDTNTLYIDSTQNMVGFGTTPQPSDLTQARVQIVASDFGSGLSVSNGNSSGNIVTLKDNITNVVTVADGGAATFKNSVNSTAGQATAFRVQNATGVTALGVDTSGNTVSVNGGVSSYTQTSSGPLFGTATTVSTGAGPIALASCDFNGDGFPDTVSGNYAGGSISVQMNINGTLTKLPNNILGNVTPKLPPHVLVVGCGDFNGDGRMDIIAAGGGGAGSNLVYIFLNNGGPGVPFSTAAITYAAPVSTVALYGLAVADFNGDGKADLAFPNSVAGSNVVYVLLNNGAGFAAPVSYAVGAATTEVATADFNNDNKPDLVFASGATVKVLLNKGNGTGTFNTTVYNTTTANGINADITTGDFNGDGHTDIAVGSATHGLSVILNYGSGTSYYYVAGTSDYPMPGISIIDVKAGDINGDGSADLVTTGINTGAITVFLNTANGTGTFSRVSPDYKAKTNSRQLVIVDVNQDGRMDVVNSNYSSNVLTVFLNQSGTTSHTNGLSVRAPSISGTALFVQGLASQQGDLLHIVDSNNNTLLAVNSAGYLGLQSVYPSNLLSVGTPATADLAAQALIGTGSSINKGLVVQGSNAQTANTFEIQDSSGTDFLNVNTSNLLNWVCEGTQTAASCGVTAPPTPINANTTPTALNDQASVTANGYVYTLGGSTTSTSASNVATVSYAKLNGDGTTGTWASTTNLPSPMQQGTSIVANGYIYYIGGMNTAGAAVKTVYYARFNSNGTVANWSTATSLPGERWGHNSVLANGYVYVLGGTDVSNVGRSTVYYAKINADGSINGWSTNTIDMTNARVGASTVFSNGTIYVIDGSLDPANVTIKTTVLSGKPNTDGSIPSWSTGPATAFGRHHGTALVSNGSVYYIAGADSNSNNTDSYSAKLNTDGTLGTWDVVGTDMPVATAHASSVTANGYIYVIGGRSTSGSNPTTAIFYVSTPRTQIGTSLDLVGLQGQNLSDPGGNSTGNAGGSLTAGNGIFVGGLQVQGQTNFGNNVNILGNLSTSGQANFINSVDSTNAFQVQNASGSTLLNVDSTNGKVYIGNPAGGSTPTLFVLNNYQLAPSDSTDPVGTNGAMYYNTAGNKFRCFQNSLWGDCIGVAGGGGGGVPGTGNINQGGNNFGSPLVLGTTDLQPINFVTGGSSLTRLTIGTTGNLTLNQSSTISTTNATNGFTLAVIAGTGTFGNGGSLSLAGGLGSGSGGNVFLNGGAGSFTSNSGSINIGTLTPGSGGSTNLEAPTGAINIGNTATAHTLNIASADNAAVDLINIGTGNSSVSGGKTINIGSGTPTGTNLITIGSIAATTNTTTIQGGNGATAVSVQAASGGTINIGSVNDNNINIGTSVVSAATGIKIGGTLQSSTIIIGQSTKTNVISIGGGVLINGNTQTIEIGNGSISAVGATGVINVSILSGLTTTTGGSATLKLADSPRVGTINIGSVANTVTRTTTIAGGNSGASDTLNIGTGNTTGAFNKTIHIGDGAPGGTGVNAITIGSKTNASTTVIQGGTGTTSVAPGISLQTVNGGMIQLGSLVGATPNVVQLGAGTGVGVTNSITTFLGLDGWSTNNTNPTGGFNGAMYYNTFSNKFRCFENGGWKDCISVGGGGATGDVNNNGNSFGGGFMKLGSIDTNALQFITNGVGNVRLTISNTGNVGIGNTAPAGLFRVGNSTAVDPGTTTQALFSTGADVNKGLVIQAFSVTQGANLQEWQASTGTAVASVSPTGVGSFSNLLQNGHQVCDSTNYIANCGWTLQSIYNASNNPEIVLGNGATKGITIRDNAVAVAGNLLEVQDNAGIVNYFKVDANGISVTGSATISNGISLTGGNLNISTGKLQVAGVDVLSNARVLTNVTYNGNTVDVAHGGTGTTSLTSNGILFGNAAGAIQATAAGLTGQCLNAATGSAPVWSACAIGATGNVNDGGNDFGHAANIGSTNVNFGMNLLAGANAVTRYSKNGEATFQSYSAGGSTTAFQVQSTGGTILFNIDSTNMRVYVGNPTPDAVGTLLVLDNKNTAGDPAGIDGAMYYNSNAGKFRCYEAGSWKDCIYTLQSAKKTADQTVSSTTYGDIGDLNFNVVANNTYKLQCTLLLSMPAGANNGANLSTNGPASPSQYTATFAKSLDSSGGDNYATSNTYDDGSSVTAFKINTVSTGSNRFIVSYSAILVNGGNSGTWSIRSRAVDGSSSITFYANSSCNLQPL